MTWFTDLLRTTPPSSPDTPQAPVTQDDPRLTVLRQKAYADALKNQKDYAKGQMVSGRFVAPSWAEQLSTAVENAMGQDNAYKGADAEFAAQKADEQQAQNWLNQRPIDQQVTIPGDAPLPEGQQGPVAIWLGVVTSARVGSPAT